jgi:hypothetical protein
MSNPLCTYAKAGAGTQKNVRVVVTVDFLNRTQSKITVEVPRLSRSNDVITAITNAFNQSEERTFQNLPELGPNTAFKFVLNNSGFSGRKTALDSTWKFIEVQAMAQTTLSSKAGTMRNVLFATLPNGESWMDCHIEGKEEKPPRVAKDKKKSGGSTGPEQRDVGAKSRRENAHASEDNQGSWNSLEEHDDVSGEPSGYAARINARLDDAPRVGQEEDDSSGNEDSNHVYTKVR